MASQLPTTYEQDRTGAEQPTYTLFASTMDGSLTADGFAHRASLQFVNLTAIPMVGTWLGAIEPGVAITYQGENLQIVLELLSYWPSVGWVHVIDNDGDSHYVKVSQGDHEPEPEDRFKQAIDRIVSNPDWPAYA